MEKQKHKELAECRYLLRLSKKLTPSNISFLIFTFIGHPKSFITTFPIPGGLGTRRQQQVEELQRKAELIDKWLV